MHVQMLKGTCSPSKVKHIHVTTDADGQTRFLEQIILLSLSSIFLWISVLK